MRQTSDYSGQQPGDPVRAAAAMIEAVARDAPPRHLVLGKFGWDAATAKLRERLAEIESLRAEAVGADFPDA